MSYFLSWPDGLCRVAAGQTLDEVEDEALSATQATNRRSCLILNEAFAPVSRVIYRSNQYTTQRSN